ncbi:oxidoreductase [Coccomyxa subellipsoidea C-169]|uniref:Oxidoreductase n=1 Tax=Coccomyxa subellipsoidea (strain C-169) TaxID=574566 RepID=I0YJA3_COCSC|nr:oxidoreductase [Coccomyxa subellipsoidea C-169]EIE18472.1 oxidoreductase [Coccomyxa subellipsoidea C-169]|eukprot:XP_005643016.1 oxidoreductase [Coccomyxa subellipsoidea C-169]
MGSSSEPFQSNGAYISQEALKLSGGCVNVLVNNAGVYFPMSLDEGPNKGQGPLDGDPDDWDKQTHINLMAPMRLTRMLLPPMKEAGQGHVVNIASIEALYPYPSAPAYSATKWGLRGWSKALFAARALKSDNIKVLTVNPAQTSTPMTWSRPDAEYLPEKMIQPSEIAEAIIMTFRLNPNAFIEEITLQTAEPPKIEK